VETPRSRCLESFRGVDNVWISTGVMHRLRALYNSSPILPQVVYRGIPRSMNSPQIATFLFG
jgi:hypothetical protein